MRTASAKQIKLALEQMRVREQFGKREERLKAILGNDHATREQQNAATQALGALDQQKSAALDAVKQQMLAARPEKPDIQQQRPAALEASAVDRLVFGRQGGAEQDPVARNTKATVEELSAIARRFRCSASCTSPAAASPWTSSISWKWSHAQRHRSPARTHDEAHA